MIKQKRSDVEYEILKHKNKMEELGYIRETERLKHEWELERGRIKSAEIRKTVQAKQMGNYWKND